MNCKYPNKVLLVFIFASTSLFAQYDAAPYKFTNYMGLEFKYIFEGCIIEKGIPNLITVQIQTQNHKVELRISDRDYRYVDNVLFNSDSCVISRDLSTIDFDKDGLDEIIVPLIFKNRTEFYLYDPGNKLNKKSFFILKGTNAAKDRRIYFNCSNLDADKNHEIVISYCENYPSAGSIRGVFGVDIETGRQLWFYPMASYFNSLNPISLPDSSEISVIIPTSAVDNGISFSDGTFFIQDDKGRNIPYKTNYTGINSSVVNPSADDFSTDSRSTILALNKHGQKVWERYLGGEFVWSTLSQVNSDIILYGQKHRSSDDSALGKIGKIDIVTGNLIDSLIVDKKIYSVRGVDTHEIILTFIDKTSRIYNANLKLINDTSPAPYVIADAFLMQDKKYYLASILQGVSIYQVILTEELEVFAAINSKFMLEYLPKLDLIKFFDGNMERLFSLEYVPWYNRISANILWTIVLSIAGLVIIVLLLWGLTMHHASKRIQLQKNEIELTTAKLIESEKLALLGTIASSLAHELNSPLGAIKNSAQRLLTGNLSESDKQGNLELIYKAVNNSAALIQNFLNRSRKKEGNNYCSISSVFDEWNLLFAKQFELLGIKIIQNVEKEFFIALSATEFQQVINNIITNAKDSLIESEVHDKQIIISLKENDDGVLIIFEDNGKGFDEEILKSAFEPFQTTKKPGYGTGLGLWIVKQILDHHGGTIEIKNIDRGSQVLIKIPKYSGTYEQQV